MAIKKYYDMHIQKTLQKAALMWLSDFVKEAATGRKRLNSPKHIRISE